MGKRKRDPVVQALYDEFALLLSDARNVECFQKLHKIGHRNTRVYKAKESETGEIVALKKIRMDEKTAFPRITTREIKILKELQHNNVMNLKELVTLQGEDKVKEAYMVLDYMDHDLYGLINFHGKEFDIPHVKFAQV